jgi:hypothetical protein
MSNFRAMDLTAGALVDAYKELGGTISIETGIVWFGFPEAGYSGRPEEPDDHLP